MPVHIVPVLITAYPIPIPAINAKGICIIFPCIRANTNEDIIIAKPSPYLRSDCITTPLIANSSTKAGMTAVTKNDIATVEKVL